MEFFPPIRAIPAHRSRNARTAKAFSSRHRVPAGTFLSLSRNLEGRGFSPRPSFCLPTTAVPRIGTQTTQRIGSQYVTDAGLCSGQWRESRRANHVELPSMELRRHRLRMSDQRVLANESSNAVHTIRAHGRGAQIEIPAGWISVCWAVRGRLCLAAGGCEWELASGEVQVWRDTPLQCRSGAHHGWIVATGPRRAWNWLSQQRESVALPELFPWQDRIRRDAAHTLSCMVKEGVPKTPERDRALAVALWGSLREAQGELHDRLARCSGRSLVRRQQMLVRLLRVRHAIRHSEDQRPNLAGLARMANYSTFHLIRVHRMVFDETPFEYAARLRMERAWRMVNDTDMPVCEITEMLGFESQSAFCRVFKSAFGTTASEVRRGIEGLRTRAA
ncbi:MAG TPA: AraC family transcriptional regulator [Pseudoxanthomonas sp.]|nr:AraC family transcriptional regulator [Pseudoxanthomonas sp.]